MREPDAVGDRADLHRDLMAVDGALPDRLARRPGRGQDMRMAGVTVGADKPDRNALGFARNVEQYLMALQPDRAAALAMHGPAVELTGNLPLTLAEHVIDRSAHRS